MFVVRDKHHRMAIQKLKDSGLTQAAPDCRAAPEIMESQIHKPSLMKLTKATNA